MASLTLDTKVKLNNGIDMPVLGLGVWQIENGPDTEAAVSWALEAGYRHIDTAAIYNNEESVGKAIKTSKLDREELFITTKVWNSDHGYAGTIKAWEQSAKRLNVDYVDLYLIHWPVEGLRLETWRAMETLYKEGKCRAIGVSNYTSRHLEELLGKSDMVPAVNQVEFSPFLYQQDLLDFCQKNKIIVEAYSPLTRGRKLTYQVLIDIAAKKNKTPAQVLIRWSLQHNLIVIPKSAKRDHIIENSKVFDFNLSPGEMDQLNNIQEHYRVAWDPSTIP